MPLTNKALGFIVIGLGILKSVQGHGALTTPPSRTIAFDNSDAFSHQEGFAPCGQSSAGVPSVAGAPTVAWAPGSTQNIQTQITIAHTPGFCTFQFAPQQTAFTSDGNLGAGVTQLAPKSTTCGDAVTTVPTQLTIPSTLAVGTVGVFQWFWNGNGQLYYDCLDVCIGSSLAACSTTPSTATPSTATPTTAKATTATPTTATPTTAKATTATPTTAVPTTATPTTKTPTTATPTTATPTTKAPTVTPSTAAPTTVKPTTAAATTKAPTAAATTAAATTQAPTTAAAPTLFCVLTVPADPLTAAGLATPYTVSGSGCVQTLATGTFVQGVIIDLDTGKLFSYNPLVINAGSTPAIPPVVPTLPANNLVALWFGTNGVSTTLQGTTGANGIDSLVQANCVNGGGSPYSIFGQFAACNGRAFFEAANALIRAGKLVIPPLGVDNQGNPCPSTHDFGVVDQDPSDNTVTKYIVVTSTGQTAQFNAANVAALTPQGITVIDNGSDEQLLTLIDQSIGCQRFTIPDLTDPTGATTTASLATNELQARLTLVPRAFIPANDPMVLNGAGNPDVNKLNAYRAQIGEGPVVSVAQASTLSFCNNLYAVGAPRIVQWAVNTFQSPAPDFAAALSNTLGGVLIARFGATIGAGNLNCVGLLNKPNPFTIINVPPNGALPAGTTAAKFLGVDTMTPDTNAVPGAPVDSFGNPVQDNANVQGDTTMNNGNVGASIAIGLGVGLFATAIGAFVVYKVGSNKPKNTF